MSQARQFRSLPVHRGYQVPVTALVDHALYDRVSVSGWENIVERFTVPARTGKAWVLKAGQTCRIVLQGSQVGDVNLWNLHDFSERFYSGKTRQLQRAHLTTYDRLWSCLPHLRPMATITRDSLASYGIDEDGCSVHDVLGTRCDPYVSKLITGELPKTSCHQILMEAVRPWGLTECDVHDVFNIFMCTGIDAKTHEYLIKGTPALAGDYIEWVAEMDLLVALSVCPHGDVSMQVGEEVPGDVCHGMEVYIGQPDTKVIQAWAQKE